MPGHPGWSSADWPVPPWSWTSRSVQNSEMTIIIIITTHTHTTHTQLGWSSADWPVLPRSWTSHSVHNSEMTKCLSGTIFTCPDCVAHFVMVVTNFNALHISLSQAHVFVVCVCVCVCLGVCVCVCMCVCACKHIHGPLQALPGSYETDTTATAVNKSGTGQRTTHLSRRYGTDMIAEIDRPVVQVPLAPSSVARSVLQGWANAMPPLCWAVVEA